MEEVKTDSGEKPSAAAVVVDVGIEKKADKHYDTGDKEDQNKVSEFINDGCLRIPTVACTNETFFHYLPRLSFRDILCWALRAETNIRLSKIKKSATMNEGNENDDSYSKTLNSTCLIDIYPMDDDHTNGGLKSDTTAMGHEEYKLSRKSHPQLSFLEDQTGNFNGLTPIEIEKKESKKKRQLSSSDEYGYASGYDSDQGEDEDEVKVFSGRRVVPPTLLHFEIILEAFMGYSLGGSAACTSCYNSPDSSLPRSAVMGGAVVAALTAYQDKIVVEAFERSNIFTQEGKLPEEKIYWGAKIELIKELHNHFIYKESNSWSSDPPCSLYAKGDVDIFLQSSPLTQKLVNVFLENGIVQEQIDMIGSYIGNAGLCEGDLERYVTKVMGEDGYGVIGAPEETQFAYAVSKTSVSFILGKEDMYDDGPSLDTTFWPRSSQFIMLDGGRQADLVGGLLDFDMSVVSCSYDGISVLVSPRAALSLMTSSNFITPFCFEEYRNKKRVIKYARRGFKPFLVDPQDNSPLQNVACDATIKRKKFLPNHVKWYKDNRQDANADIVRIQEEKMKTSNRMLCCHTLGPANYETNYYKEDDYRRLGSDARQHRPPGMVYTMKMFETTPGDAISFFEERFDWSAEDLAAVNEIDPYLRMACTKCKNEYNLIRVVMKNYPDLMKVYDLEDDNLRGDFAYRHTCGGGAFVNYEPSFYGGGVFNSTCVRNNARPTIQILAMLHSQSIFEVCAYVMKHGSPNEYKKRFVYGSDLVATLQKASKTPLQKAARSPIGLNPERIVDRCEQCQNWLLGNCYGVKDCRRCSK